MTIVSPEFHATMVDAIGVIEQAHYALLEANRAAASIRNVAARRVVILSIDAATLETALAKWQFGIATGDNADFSRCTGAIDDLAAAIDSARRAMRLLHEVDPGAASAVLAQVGRGDGEIEVYRGMPIVPSIAPVVVLTGSSREMGRQYAEQCLEIFGRFVFETVATRTIGPDEHAILRKWEAEIAKVTPDVLEYAAGMAEGATHAGVSMDYDHALAMWTDLVAPSEEPLPIGVLDAIAGGRMTAYFGAGAAPLDRAEIDAPCSGFAAWGRATRNGKLHAVGTTDHDCTFQVTILAFPEDGHAFIYTPFSANGSIPGVGRFGFAGHPGFNAVGLAYVHHGGCGALAEPRSLWGYGVPRGAATIHLLRRAGSRAEAEAAELGYPVGDVARILGTAGGFWADESGVSIIERRDPDHPVIRRGFQGHDFAYSTNNPLSREMCDYFCAPEAGYQFEGETGPFTLDPAAMLSGSPGAVTRHMWAASSESRNRFLAALLSRDEGHIDADWLIAAVRTGPGFESAPWPETEAKLRAGERLEGSNIHRLNAFVATMVPDAALYTGAIGPQSGRAASPNRPGHGYFYVDETATHWSIRLLESAAATVRGAIAKQLELAQEAQAVAPIGTEDWLAEAMAPTILPWEETDPAILSRALRRALRAQVRARQVIESIQPPPVLNYPR